jgi:hypothetical protein
MNGTPITQQLRGSIDKWEGMKPKYFCTEKEVATRLKRQPTEWEKISAAIHLTRD